MPSSPTSITNEQHAVFGKTVYSDCPHCGYKDALATTRVKGRPTLFFCHAGCSQEEVLRFIDDSAPRETASIAARRRAGTEEYARLLWSKSLPATVSRSNPNVPWTSRPPGSPPAPPRTDDLGMQNRSIQPILKGEISRDFWNNAETIWNGAREEFRTFCLKRNKSAQDFPELFEILGEPGERNADNEAKKTKFCHKAKSQRELWLKERAEKGIAARSEENRSNDEHMDAVSKMPSKDPVSLKISSENDSFWKELGRLVESGECSNALDGYCSCMLSAAAMMSLPNTWHGTLEAWQSAILERVRKGLDRIMLSSPFSLRDRATAGRRLAEVGDGRRGIGTALGRGLDFIFQRIEAGEFMMGTSKGGEFRDEEPQFGCKLIRRPYDIAIYPITVAQFAPFVSTGGYRERTFWTEAGWKWREDLRIEGPMHYGPDYLAKNQPQVGVSWYEAVAYCRWLTASIGKGESTYRIPTEVEWERAARHTDGREYPWGSDERSMDRCNIGNSLGHPTAVGMFPNGIAVCGAADLGGNVWELCLTKWTSDYNEYERSADNTEEGDDMRVMRGGAFNAEPDRARCAFRRSPHPYDRTRCYGFRVVMETIDSQA